MRVLILQRHGTRFPTKGDMDRMRSSFEYIKANEDKISDTSLNWLKAWVFPYKKENAGMLTSIGIKEHYDMSKRVVTQLKHLFVDYHAQNHSIQATESERTTRSAGSFGHGLFEGNGPLNCHNPLYIFSDPLDNDPKLRFFSMCDRFKQKLELVKESNESRVYYEKGIPRVLSKIEKKLGFPLKEKYADSLFSLCVFDFNLHGITNRWCSLFDEEDAKFFETYQDIKTYYERGYGDKLNYEISCALLGDFFESFDLAVEGKQVADLRFAHAETIIPFISLLGLYKDKSPLSPDLPDEELENRQWKLSLISPFSANLMTVMYKCESSQTPYLVKFLHNEQEVKIPACKEKYCDIEELKKAYASFLNCDVKEQCRLPVSTSKSTGFIGFIILLGLTIIILIVAYVYSRK